MERLSGRRGENEGNGPRAKTSHRRRLAKCTATTTATIPSGALDDIGRVVAGYVASLKGGEMKIALEKTHLVDQDEVEGGDAEEPLGVYRQPIAAASLQSSHLLRAFQRYKMAPGDDRTSSDLILMLSGALRTSQDALHLLRSQGASSDFTSRRDEDIYRAIALESVAHDQIMARSMAAARKATMDAFHKTMQHMNGLSQAYEHKAATTFHSTLRALKPYVP